VNNYPLAYYFNPVAKKAPITGIIKTKKEVEKNEF